MAYSCFLNDSYQQILQTLRYCILTACTHLVYCITSIYNLMFHQANTIFEIVVVTIHFKKWLKIRLGFEVFCVCVDGDKIWCFIGQFFKNCSDKFLKSMLP